ESSDKIHPERTAPIREKSTMRAVTMKEFGAPQVLQLAEVPDVAAGAGEVAIDVEFANVTFVETQIRAGRPPNPAMLPTLPAVLGNGVGGTVTEAGPGADPDLVGRRVVASLTGTGGYAERAVAAEQRLIDVPGQMDLRDASRCWLTAALPLPWRAWRGSAAVTPSSSRQRRAEWERSWSSLPATPARASSRWPAANASSRRLALSGPTWSSTTAAGTGRCGPARLRAR